jgi:hypothetical protein
MSVRAGNFSIDDSPVYPGYTGGDIWNGWATPLFTREQAVEVLTQFNGPAMDPDDFINNHDNTNNSWTYDPATDSFRIYDYNYADSNGDGGIMEAQGEDCILTGSSEQIRLYDVTSGYCWDERDEDLPRLLVEITFTPDPGESIYKYAFKNMKAPKSEQITKIRREIKVIPLNDWESALASLPAYAGRRGARYQYKILAENMTNDEILILSGSCQESISN